MYEKHSRAVQFMPFDSLKSIRPAEKDAYRESEERKILSEERAAALSGRLGHLRRGMKIRIRYYTEDGYVTEEGEISEINGVFGYLCIGRKKIEFNDVTAVYYDRAFREERNTVQ